MRPIDLEVVSAIPLATVSATGASIMYLECLMSDGSLWDCDMDMKGWKRIIPSPSELTIAFRNR